MLRFSNNIFSKSILTFFCSVFMMTTVFSATPLWTFESVTATTISVPSNATAMVQYRVINQSHKPRTLAMQPIRGITQITTGPNVCGNPFVLSGKNSCILSLQINGSQLNDPVTDGPVVCQLGNINQCYRPSSANILRITRGSDVADAEITANPPSLLLVENSTGDVTVTNNAASQVTANNVVASVPGGSNISVQSTTCGASLAIGASCTITFASGAQEGPTTISIAGNNTNTVNVDVTVTSRPQISITNPVQQSRVITVSGAALSLEITNDAGSVVNANAITVSDKTACPNLSVNDSNCASVAPGGSCMLELTSNTPYVPCRIVVSGSNTANSPATYIAFSHLGGLVFEESGGSGKVVTNPLNDPNELTIPWSTQNNNIVTDSSNGAQNTTNIINTDPGCTTVGNCAARRCRNISADWYLPARNELSTVHAVLCPNNSIPCRFGGFSSAYYWSSTGLGTTNAWFIFFPSGVVAYTGKPFPQIVRCVRAFTP